MSEYVELQEQLAKSPINGGNPGQAIKRDAFPSPPTPATIPSASTLCQWYIGPNDAFRAAGATRQTLPSGVYNLEVDGRDGAINFNLIKIITDKLITLDDSASRKVLEDIRKFWQSRDAYKHHGLLYKRGVLLWGPPGSGKTVTVTMLVKELIEANGVVILSRQHPDITIGAIRAFRRVEPTRNLVVVFEDIEEIIQMFGEHAVLSLLDGEDSTDNVVNLATTNYPEMLGARIVNRPSRFDIVTRIGMPSHNTRLKYFHTVCPEMPPLQAIKWAKDTEGMSIAHLRELVSSVYCLGGDYDETLIRLKSMKTPPKSGSDGALGFQ